MAESSTTNAPPARRPAARALASATYALPLVAAALMSLSPLVASPAGAQMRPATSGDPSFYEPEMKRHGSGFAHPNEPQRHRRRRAVGRR